MPNKLPMQEKNTMTREEFEQKLNALLASPPEEYAIATKVELLAEFDRLSEQAELLRGAKREEGLLFVKDGQFYNGLAQRLLFRKKDYRFLIKAEKLTIIRMLEEK